MTFTVRHCYCCIAIHVATHGTSTVYYPAAFRGQKNNDCYFPEIAIPYNSMLSTYIYSPIELNST